MITSLQNQGVKEIIALRNKRKARTKMDAFLVEGPKMAEEAPAESLLRVYYSASYYEQHHPAAPEKCPWDVVSDPVFEAMSDTQTPQGVLCVVKQRHYQKEDLFGGPGAPARREGMTAGTGLRAQCGEGSKAPLCIILEDIQDPGNLGTILRTAEGAGVTGVLMSEGCADIYSPKVIRSTMGAIYRVPFLRTDAWREIAASWRTGGMRIQAAYLGGSRPYDEEDYTGASGILIGNESRGLSDDALWLADCRIRIPMEGKVESLNASIAAALIMYEASRQRRHRHNTL